jgi:hypothetical protein
VIQGSAKAWVNYNGSTNAIRSSYNVSSVTFISTGAWTVNFTNALANSNYATHVTATDGSYGTLQGGGAYSTTAVGVIARTHTGTLENPVTMCVSAFVS